MALEEGVFLAQEEDLLLGQEEDLLLGQEEDLLLAREKHLLLAPLGQPGGSLNLEMLGGQPGWSVGRPAWLARAATPTLECWISTNQSDLILVPFLRICQVSSGRVPEGMC